MGWKKRNKSWYYYKTFYVAGKYFDVYCGGAARGAALEQFLREEKARLREVRRQIAELKAELKRRGVDWPGAGPIGATDRPVDGRAARRRR